MMKFLLSALVVTFFSISVFPQGRYTVPGLTDLQKYQNAALEWNASSLIQISYAKSLGKSVEDAGRFMGDQLNVTWNKAGGFDGLVRGLLYMMVTLVPYGSVEITTQTYKGLVYKVTGLYPELREGGSIYNVSWDEYIKFWGTAFSRLAEKMGANYSQNDTDEGLVVTITKK